MCIETFWSLETIIVGYYMTVYMLNVHGRLVFSCNSARIVFSGWTGASSFASRVFLNGIKNTIIIDRLLHCTPRYTYTIAVNVRLAGANFFRTIVSRSTFFGYWVKYTRGSSAHYYCVQLTYTVHGELLAFYYYL